MLESQLNRIKGKGRKRDVIHISESESDDELPPSKKGKHIPVQLDQLTLEMKGIRKDISSVLTLSKGMKLPPGLHTLLHDTFKCNICQSSPIRPPVMFTRCCKSILGCERCVDSWYSGEDGRSKKCPLCRSERAFTETVRIHGLDDFMNAIAPLITDDVTPSAPTISSGNPSRHIFHVPSPIDSEDDFEMP